VWGHFTRAVPEYDAAIGVSRYKGSDIFQDGDCLVMVGVARAVKNLRYSVEEVGDDIDSMGCSTLLLLK